MFDRFSIRAKLIAIVVGPLVLLVVLAVATGSQRRDEARVARADAARIRLGQAAADVQHAVQLETFKSAQYLGSGGETGKAALLEQHKATDTAVDRLEDAVADSPTTDAQLGAGAVRQFRFGKAIRSQIIERDLGWYQSVQLYSTQAATAAQVSTALVERVEDPILASQLRSLTGLAGYKAAQADVASILAGAFAQGVFVRGPSVIGQDPLDDLQSAVQEATIQRSVFTSTAAPDLRRLLRNDVDGEAQTGFDQALETALGATDRSNLETDPEVWSKDANVVLNGLRSIQSSASGDLVDDASSRASSADWSSRLFLAGALLAVALVLALAIAVATSITRPLGRLTTAADRLASVQLPRLVKGLRNPEESDVAHLAADVETVSTEGGQEIGRLATSVNSIQTVAVEVATEQASLLRKGIGDMFVNLARRNQALLDRQLEFIDELEASEDDPDQLENLFKLDHMSTRMRRNAESLLVLAGAEPGRRRGRPLPLADVVRAAVGEVEDFTRIDLLDLDPVSVSSGAGSDVAHLLSELMENATHFSPPDTRIEVVGHHSSAEGYVVSVIDSGIGMSTDQIDAANELLARPPLVGLTLSRTLGFIVVARLAQRHGISVRLLPSPAGGITTVVALPASIITTTTDELDLVDRPGGTVDTGSTVADDSPTSGPAPYDFELQPDVFAGPSEPSTPATLAEALPEGADLDAALDEINASTTSLDAPDLDGTGLGAPEPTSVDGRTADQATPDRVADDTDTDDTDTDDTDTDDTDTDDTDTDTDDGNTALPVGPRPGVRSDAPPRVDGLPTRRPVATTTHAASSTMPEPLPGPSAPVGSDTGPEPLLEGASVASRNPLFTGPSSAPAETVARSDSPEPPREAGHPEPVLFGSVPSSGPSNGAGSTGAGSNGAGSNGSGSNGHSAGALSGGTRLFGGSEPSSQIANEEAPGAGGSSGEVSTAAPQGGLTSSGLVRRVPRRAGAARSVPGADGPTRAVSGTQRSPDEVRSMLSRFRTGSEHGRSAPDQTIPDHTISDHTISDHTISDHTISDHTGPSAGRSQQDTNEDPTCS